MDHTPSWYPKTNRNTAPRADHTPGWYPKEQSTTPEIRPTAAESTDQSLEIVPLDQPLYQGPRTNRRAFLTLAAAAGAAAIGGAGLLRGETPVEPTMGSAMDAQGAVAPPMTVQPPPVNVTSTRTVAAGSDLANRTLVVVELQGGNDGLATLVPRNAGALYDTREAVHIPDEELLDFTDDFGWNPKLAGLSGHGMAAVLGLGATTGFNGSHFEMEQRWWAGKSSGQDLPFTGFFGRLCDQLAVDQPVTGVSLGSNASPALRADHAVTVGLSDYRAGWFLHTDNAFYRNMRTAMAAMANGSTMPSDMSGDAVFARMTGARAGLSDTLSFGETLAEIDEERVDSVYPQYELGKLFGAASELIRQEAGIRVIHLTHGGFDTHSNQRGTHDYLLEQLGEAMGLSLIHI